MEMSSQLYTLTSLPLGKRPPPSTYCAVVWVGPRAGLDVVAKIQSPVPARNRTPFAQLLSVTTHTQLSRIIQPDITSSNNLRGKPIERWYNVSFPSVRRPIVLWELDRRSDVPSLAGPRALSLTKYVLIPRSKDPPGTFPERSLD
jgi:hypothetical protein